MYDGRTGREVRRNRERGLSSQGKDLLSTFYVTLHLQRHQCMCGGRSLSVTTLSLSMTQIWSPEGTAIQTTNHHNKQVESLLVTPLTAGGTTEASGKVWTCAADGTVYFWTDTSASGHFESSTGKSISVPGNKRKASKLLICL